MNPDALPDFTELTLAELFALYQGLPDPVPDALRPNAARTRRAIIDSTRALIARRGYEAVRIADIAVACHISRATFYTYFKDKREVMALLAMASFRECLTVIERWPTLPVEDWIREYNAFLDVHGLFMGAGTVAGPEDEQAAAVAGHLRTRIVEAMGSALQARRTEPAGGPDELGMAALALLNRAWLGLRLTGLPVDGTDLIRAEGLLLTTLTATQPTRTGTYAEPAPLGPEDPVLAAARSVFVARGFAVPAPAELAAACGISGSELELLGGKAGLFERVGAAALAALLAAVDAYGELPQPCTAAAAAGWVAGFFAVLDRHGRFLFHPGLAATTDPEFRRQSFAHLMRGVWGLGTRLRVRQVVPTDAPDALGLAVLGMVSDSWFYARGQGHAVDSRSLIVLLGCVLVAVPG